MSDEVVRLLQKAYQDEIETVMNYMTNSIVLDAEEGAIETYRALVHTA